MKNYPEYKELNLPKIDQELLAWWKTEQIFERSMQEREGQPSFVFYEGPPSANGMPGIHHVLARSVKDAFCRYQTMKGKLVRRKAGWDTHGLPIELAVEKKLGITKEAIGKSISVAEYNRLCRQTVMEFKDVWDDLTEKMGYWVDLANPYITYDNTYIESVWHLLQKLYQKNLLYKGYTIQPYSPAAGTGLSSHELNQPGCYRNVKDTTCVGMFLAKGSETEAVKRYFLAWTTTPWTLPANTALAVGPNIKYAEVQTLNPYTATPVRVILAKDLLSRYFKADGQDADAQAYGQLSEEQRKKSPMPWTVLHTCLGKELVGQSYWPLFQELELVQAFAAEHPQAFHVIAGDFVSTEDGTGIVHISPTFGADDRRVADDAGIPGLMTVDAHGQPSPIVDLQGKYVPGMGTWAGRWVKAEYGDGSEERPLDVDLCIFLKDKGQAFKIEKYEHNYPHCWRTDKPVLYYPLDSWFIRASAAKERMAELNKTINWKPKATGEGRFGGWLENLRDWNLSRSRYWGIPLPIWRNEEGNLEVCIGSVAELLEQGYMPLAQAQAHYGYQGAANAQGYVALKELQASLANFDSQFDLHKPFADDIFILHQGQYLRREADLIDVWFDSGAMPYAQWHYPFENRDLIENGLNANGKEHAFPADFIAEGVDQTRGWFYTLHAIAVMCFDSVAYKNVVSNGLVLDKDGRKMSKRLGNAVDPFETIKQYGADATRWYMLTNAQPWDDLRFNLEILDETRRQFFGTLYNTYMFFATYANIDEFKGQAPQVPLAERPEIDRWILSKLHSLIREVDADYADYEPTNAGRKIEEFVDRHLSNWYVRLCRRRFWKSENGQDKLAAYQTLYECLLTLSKLMAPVAPFFSDWLYRNLNGTTGLEPHISVHLAFMPAVNEAAIDTQLEQRMDYAQRICSLAHSLRKGKKIRVRQPLQKILLPVLDASFAQQVDLVKDLILSEVNVKELEYISDASGMLKKKVKPNFRTMGKKLGGKMKAGQALVEAFTQADIQTLERTGQYILHLEGEDFVLSLEDFIISSEDLEGWLVANDGDLVVALDLSMTPELEAEGMARELVNRIQNLRKDKDFEVTDRIALSLQKHQAIEDALKYFQQYICHEVLATEFNLLNDLPEGEEVELTEQVVVKIALRQLS